MFSFLMTLLALNFVAKSYNLSRLCGSPVSLEATPSDTRLALNYCTKQKVINRLTHTNKLTTTATRLAGTVESNDHLCKYWPVYKNNCT